MYILENSDLQPLLKSIKELTEEVHKLSLKSASDNIFSVKDTAKVLNVSLRTLQAYRDKGMISFSQAERNIFFRYSDIEEFLNKYHIKAFKK